MKRLPQCLCVSCLLRHYPLRRAAIGRLAGDFRYAEDAVGSGGVGAAVIIAASITTRRASVKQEGDAAVGDERTAVDRHQFPLSTIQLSGRHLYDRLCHLNRRACPCRSFQHRGTADKQQADQEHEEESFDH